MAFAGGSQAGGPNIMVSLDGEPLHEVTQFQVKGLPAGTHDLVLGAPNQNSEVRFGGLQLDPGATTLPVEERPIIEFVGDSITTGGGQTRPNTINYAWQTAEALGADHTQIAFSARALTTGFGCAQDKAGQDNQYFLLKNFNHLADPLQIPWDFSYRPAVAVINLGQNDQCGAEPPATFTASYITFLKKLRTKLPQAQIVALRPFSGAFESSIKEAVATVTGTGDTHINFVDTSGWLEKDDFVDHIHPNQAGHDKVAQRLAPLIRPWLASRVRSTRREVPDQQPLD